LKPELTPSQTVGPFFGFALPYSGDHRLVAPDSKAALRVEGQVIDGAGEPVPDALVEMWQGNLFGRCGTDPEGAFRFVVAKPPALPGQAPHLNVTVFARGLLRHLVTRMYFPDEAAANATDPVLGLVAEEARRETLVARDENGLLRFDIRLQGDGETVFFAV
jgi:protocatechuate 3,4-dioxygenase alpha subunit